MNLPAPGHLMLAFGLACGVAFAARTARALSVSGAVGAAVVGFLLFGLGGGRGATALLLFFVSSSALSRVGKKRKDALQFEKGGERDAGQVLANGGVAALCALLLPTTNALWPVAALLGALASANADTWATELGSLAKGKPRLITTFATAPTGSSGAISLPGTLAALAGAAFVAVVAFGGWGGGTVFLAATLGGLGGALFDSLLGATVQAQYRCTVCGKLTERLTHCEQPTTLERGLAWLNNDWVNALSTLAGAVFAVLLWRILAR